MRLREVAQNLALSLVSFVLFVGVAEGFFRFRERGRPRPVVAPYITDWQDWDGDFYTVKSTAVGWPPWEDYNSDGLRDREHEVRKPSGVRRVVCLGDSTTLGWGLPPHEAYPQVLEERLESGGDLSEVFNVGLGGWSTRQELLAYRRIARKYRPDVVLLGICLNDVAEMQNNLSRPPRWLTRLFARSAAVRGVLRPEAREIAAVEDLFHDKDSPRVREGFRRVFADLRTLRDEVLADGGRFGVLVFPFRFQVQAKAPPPTPQDRIAAFCRSEGLACLDLLPALRREGPKAFHDIDHFSAPGARLVADEILASGLLGGAPSESSPSAAPASSSQSVDSLLELLQTLERGTDREKASAARALGRLGSSAAPASAALTALLASESAAVRAAASRALGTVAPLDPSAQQALVERLGDPAERVRLRASESLQEMPLDPGSCLAGLVELLRAAGSPGRVEAAQVLGSLGPVAAPAVAELTAALQDEDPRVRARSAWALGRIGPAAAAAVPALLDALADPDIRWWVVDALGGLGPRAAPSVPALMLALRDESSSVRWRATLALAAIGRAAGEAAPGLVRASADERDSVRLGALGALEAVGAPAAIAVSAYRGALRDPVARVRVLAARQLGRLGPDGRDASPELLALLSDEDPAVQEEARRALDGFGPLPRAVRDAIDKGRSEGPAPGRPEAAGARR